MTDELIKKEKRAIEILKTFQPSEAYYGCYSGGKDSDTIYILGKLAGINVEWHHNLTTVDAPETVNYVRSHKDIIIDRPEKTMWQLIVENGMPPTRLARYCCRILKEREGTGQLTITGVRWAESLSRSESSDVVKIISKGKDTAEIAAEAGANYKLNKFGGVLLNDDNDESRRVVEQCYRTRKTLINPIVDWTDEDVWEFLHHYGCESNPLYECGYKRIGCIGCPMASKGRYKQFERYPKYKENYIKAFDRMIIARSEKGKSNNWNSGEECFRWWMGEDINQIRWEDLE
jgi:phosphoadenosine phosphosulfate reductase